MRSADESTRGINGAALSACATAMAVMFFDGRAAVSVCPRRFAALVVGFSAAGEGAPFDGNGAAESRACGTAKAMAAAAGIAGSLLAGRPAESPGMVSPVVLRTAFCVTAGVSAPGDELGGAVSAAFPIVTSSVA